MADLSQMSDAELMAIAGISPQSAAAPAPDLSQMSTEELMQIAGGGAQAQPQQPESFGSLLRQGVVSAAQAVPFVDEAAAGVRSVLPGFQDYDSELAAIRQGQKAYAERHPYANVANQIAGSLPLMAAIPTSVGKGATTLANVGRGAAEGAAYSGVYGFAGGEGGLENRLQAAKEGATGGALVGGAIPAVGSAVKKTGSALINEGRKLELSAFGGTKGKIAKAIDRMPDVLDKNGKFNNPISDAIKSFRADGGGKDLSPAKLIGELDGQIESRLGKLDELLLEAEKRQSTAIIPEFNLTKKYIADLPGVDIKAAQKIADEAVLDTINNLDGTITAMNREKQKLSTRIKDTAWGSDAASQMQTNILKRVRADLRKSIEDNYKALTGKPSKVIADLNSEIGQRESLYPLFSDMLAGGESRNVFNWLMQNMRTSGGFGSTAITSAVTGAAAGLPAALAAPVIGGAIISPPGRKLTGDLVRGVGKGYNAMGGAALGAAIEKTSPLTVRAASLARQGIADSEGQGPEGKLRQPARANSARPIASPLLREAGRPSSPQTGATGVSLRSSSPNNTPVDNQIQQALSQVPPGLRKLVAAMIQVESRGNPAAVSKKGARGVMQLMPATAKELGVTDPHDIAQNIAGGTKYVQQNLKKYGDLALALSAYNFGPGNLDAAIKKAGTTDIEKLRGYLPRETRSYIDQVTALMG